VSEIPIGGTTAALGDTLGNGLRRSTELISESRIVRLNAADDRIEAQQNRACLLPNKEIAEWAHGHTLTGRRDSAGIDFTRRTSKKC
jgi:hypothetical protein